MPGCLLEAWGFWHLLPFPHSQEHLQRGLVAPEESNLSKGAVKLAKLPEFRIPGCPWMLGKAGPLGPTLPCPHQGQSTGPSSQGQVSHLMIHSAAGPLAPQDWPV